MIESLDEKFNWKLHPKSQRFLNNLIRRFLKKNKFSNKISKHMKEKTSTRLFDWIDHIAIQRNEKIVKRLKELGFRQIKREVSRGETALEVEGSILFPILLRETKEFEISIKCDDIEHFKKKNKIKSRIIGKKYSEYRKLIISEEHGTIFSVVERRGFNGFLIKKSKDTKEYLSALKKFSKRRRKFKEDSVGINYTKKLVKEIVKKITPQRAADAFFRSERDYWEDKNSSGRLQKKRQDLLGLGWGNHDHHTYRCSRENFAKIVSIFEILGFECRERFYAGEAAGWGAQVLEHPECDIVLFADVDISKKEKDHDFAHIGLGWKKELRTVGLWVGLHGESMLQAGMHHLEARFMFDKLRSDMKRKGHKTMKPFSYFKFLKQAFTKGEWWKVGKSRALRLLKKNQITKEQYMKFVKEGAIGSHLENLERKQGYKGFNQDSVTAIIRETDPRKQKNKGA